MKLSVWCVLASSLVFGLAARASANPTPEAKVRELEAKLRDAQEELRRLRAPRTREVDCERADLERRRPSFGPDILADPSRFFEQLAGRPVDPVYDRRTVGSDAAVPIAFMVRPGCSFSGGEEITEVDGVPIAERARVRALLQGRDRWRFTVTERPRDHEKMEIISDRNAFDLASALGVSGSEAKVVPYTAGKDERGFLVWSVTPGGYFASAGLQPKDVLISANRIPLSHAQAEAIINREWKAKRRLAIEVLRDGRPFFLRTIAAGQ